MFKVSLVKSICPPSVIKVYLCFSPFSLCHLHRPTLEISRNLLARTAMAPTPQFITPRHPLQRFITKQLRNFPREDIYYPLLHSSHTRPHAMGYNQLFPNISPHTSSNDFSLSQFRDLLFLQPQLLPQNLHQMNKMCATLI